MSLAYINVAVNLLLYSANPAWGSLALVGIWLLVAALYTAIIVKDRRRVPAAARHPFLFGGPVGTRAVVLERGESLVALPNGWSRLETTRGTRYVKACSHWPRDEVKLADGTTAAYICRRCGHDWVNEDYVRSGVEW